MVHALLLTFPVHLHPWGTNHFSLGGRQSKEENNALINVVFTWILYIVDNSVHCELEQGFYKYTDISWNDSPDQETLSSWVLFVRRKVGPWTRTPHPWVNFPTRLYGKSASRINFPLSFRLKGVERVHTQACACSAGRKLAWRVDALEIVYTRRRWLTTQLAPNDL